VYKNGFKAKVHIRTGLKELKIYEITLWRKSRANQEPRDTLRSVIHIHMLFRDKSKEPSVIELRAPVSEGTVYYIGI